ncbi:alpha/beta hydrolase domain-containing protein [Duganella sp. P38]|uniref:alpha/beta hydrolase domain-containing protein n=1 Tax=Duganella sp. P38 TaxID=3423949 RepID=UPI003D7C026C
MKRTLMALAVAAMAAGAQAAVERVEVTERVPFAPGVTFGEYGAYEKIRGVAYYALDPKAAANASIVDLKRAQRDRKGRVLFSSEFVLLRPAGAQPTTLLYDVNNRGNIAILGQVNGRGPARNDPATAADAGDGFLMRHGFSLLFSAWTWDVAPTVAAAGAPPARPLVFAPPVAKGVKGRVYNEFTVNAPIDTVSYAGMRGLTYEPATPNDPRAQLTQRARPGDRRRPIARSAWKFVAPELKGGPGRVWLEGGFQPDTIYEISYVAQDPYVTGAGLAGIRDLLSYFRDHPFEGAPAPRNVLMFGISQSGRLIGRMMHDGLNVDEGGKLVFNGAYLQVPGAGGSAGFNSRFAQPTRHPSMMEEHEYPADTFPFTSTATRDPVSGRTASTLDKARDKQGKLPKLIYANTSTEFWNRGASLIATTPDGERDVAPADNVRLYGFMGAQHYVGRSNKRAPFTACVSTSDHYLPMRALIVALDEWTVNGRQPPASAYPSLADGTLTTVADYRAIFPKGLGITPPEQNLREPRLDFGRRFAAQGIADTAPPRRGDDYETRVPTPDADGNDRGGVRLVELQAPLGTHTGWNLRAPETGFAWATSRFDGSFVPFARTEAERMAAGDPRPSLESRYPTRDAYAAAVRAAAQRRVAAGLLLPEDVERAMNKNLGLYDRILARDPADPGCGYLFPSSGPSAPVPG